MVLVVAGEQQPKDCKGRKPV